MSPPDSQVMSCLSLQTPRAATSFYADTLIRAGRIYTLEPDAVTNKRAVAIRDGHIWAVSDQLEGLDACIGPNTRVLDLPSSTVLPAFDDIHTHFIFAGLSQFDVPVHEAADICGFLDLIRQRAAQTPPGRWITTTANWFEQNLAERRFPTLEELDDISTAHPIVVRRGGHNAVANTAALTMAGMAPGGDGPSSPDGHLQDAALALLARVMPSPTLQERVAGLEAASRAYAATGIGCVRDCYVTPGDLDALQAAHDAGRLHVRVRALVGAMGLTTAGQVDDLVSRMEAWRPRQTDPWFSVWGVKFFVDGGFEACATEEPYVGREGGGCCGCDSFRGIVAWDPDEFVEAVDVVVRRGWKVGTHAFGDRAVRILLDAYERVLRRHPNLPPNTLVMEHGGMVSKEQRARAAKLGIPVTIQAPLLYEGAIIFPLYVGEERLKHLFPAREWLDAGALVAAGSDYPAGKFGAMHSIWDMATRETVAGVRGPEHAITIGEAVALHTTSAARLLGETSTRGMLTPGRFADLTVWPRDPLEAGSLVNLGELLPSHTMVGGIIRCSPEAGSA